LIGCCLKKLWSVNVARPWMFENNCGCPMLITSGSSCTMQCIQGTSRAIAILAQSKKPPISTILSILSKCQSNLFWDRGQHWDRIYRYCVSPSSIWILKIFLDDGHVLVVTNTEPLNGYLSALWLSSTIRELDRVVFSFRFNPYCQSYDCPRVIDRQRQLGEDPPFTCEIEASLRERFPIAGQELLNDESKIEFH